ncbi:hypothetical protein QTP86_004995 [Hemibagrus guttatus]|nr:hypothetical protein QTP86_004995 [Hemibagrus guttatus]
MAVVVNPGLDRSGVSSGYSGFLPQSKDMQGGTGVSCVPDVPFILYDPCVLSIPGTIFTIPFIPYIPGMTGFGKQGFQCQGVCASQ